MVNAVATAPIFADISAWQELGIDWVAYRTWAASFDGVSRVSMRSSYGHGYTDAHFDTYRHGATSAHIDVMIFYHYAYPQFNAPEAEADYQRQVVGDIRPQDVIMLDYEENHPASTADWAYRWLSRQEANYRGKLPTIYASDAFIRAHLQDSRLARFPLTLANWQFNPAERPACPPPWSHYTYLQYTDRASNVPGIAGKVDANVYLGLEEVSVGIDLSNPRVAYHFAKVSDTEWRCLSNNVSIKGPVLTFYQNFGNAALCGLTWLGLPQSPELPIPGSQHGATMQHFENGVLALDVAHEFDIRPGDNGPVYLLKIYTGPGVDPRIAQLQGQIATYQGQITSLEQKISTSPTATMPAVDPTLQTQINTLQGQLSGAIARLAQINQLSGAGT